MPAVSLDKITFVHIPRTGGTSIGHWLLSNINSTYRYSYYDHPTISNMHCRSTSFTVVRNPWDRLVSIYHFIINLSSNDRAFRNISKTDRALLNQVSDRVRMLEFNDWIASLDGFVSPVNLPYTVFSNQIEWSKNVDIILRFESLNQDFKIIQDLLNCSSPLIHQNKTDHSAYQDIYNSYSKDLVYKWFKPDIDQLGYEF